MLFKLLLTHQVYWLKMTNPTQRAPYLRQQRDFPNSDIKLLTVQIDKAYVDTANAVNARTISIFPLDNPINTGETWYLHGSTNRQQSLRQVFSFDDSLLTIQHNLNLTGVIYFSRIWGGFQDVLGFWQTLPYIDVLNVNNQITVRVTDTEIVITKGAGTPPQCFAGLVTIEWLSQV